MATLGGSSTSLPAVAGAVGLVLALAFGPALAQQAPPGAPLTQAPQAAEREEDGPEDSRARRGGSGRFPFADAGEEESDEPPPTLAFEGESSPPASRSPGPSTAPSSAGTTAERATPISSTTRRTERPSAGRRDRVRRAGGRSEPSSAPTSSSRPPTRWISSMRSVSTTGSTCPTSMQASGRSGWARSSSVTPIRRATASTT